MEVQCLAAIGILFFTFFVFLLHLFDTIPISFTLFNCFALFQDPMQTLLDTTRLGLKMRSSTFRWSYVITAYP